MRQRGMTRLSVLSLADASGYESAQLYELAHQAGNFLGFPFPNTLLASFAIPAVRLVECDRGMVFQTSRLLGARC